MCKLADYWHDKILFYPAIQPIKTACNAGLGGKKFSKILKILYELKIEI